MAEEIVNYKKILVAYINYVRTVEGIDFIIDPVDTVADLDHPSSVRCGVKDFPDLTLSEVSELIRLAKDETIKRIKVLNDH